MKKKIIIALLAIVTAICYTLGFTACANGDNNGGGGEDYSGTYYLFEDEQYIEVEYYTLDGGNWSDAHNMGGTYEIKDGVISFYIDLFNQKTLWQQGAIGNGKLTLEGFSGKMEYYKKGMAHVHSFSEWQTVIEPDCTRAGEKIRACKCGETERQPVPALGHDLTKHIVYIPATCQSGGKMSKTCDRCGQLFEEEFNKDPDAHYIEEGKDETTCSGCGTDFGATFGFEEKDNEVILTDGDGVNVIVPAVYHGKPVTTIGEDAFSGCTSLESITIPDGVTSIDEGAFRDCDNIAGVYITDLAAWCNIEFHDSLSNPLSKGSSHFTISESATLYLNKVPVTSITADMMQGVTEIKDYAFSLYTFLTSVTIPDGVTSIGYMAFEGCTSLESVNFGNNSKLETIGLYAFFSCTSLESVNFGNDSKLETIGGSAFNDCTSLESITIPDGVTSIGIYAFRGCTSLESVNLGNDSKLETIGESAFEDCTSLTSITIPDGVTSIGYKAFWECTSLESVNFGNNSKLETIGMSAFDGCTSLTSITIPDGVTSIGGSAFFSCTSLESVNFGNDSKLETIGMSAFDGCTSLTSITIPDSVTSIGYKAFWECTSLASVNLGDGVTSIGGYAFYYCTSLESITIPDSVTSIGDKAFWECTSLTGVYITDLAAWCNIAFGDSYANPLCYAHNLYLNNEPVTAITADMLQGVTKIKDYAFYTCTSLTSITIPYGVTSIGGSAFYGCTSLESVTFTNKTGWNVSKNKDMSDAQDAPDLNDPAQNAEYFTDIYYAYYWKREE